MNLGWIPIALIGISALYAADSALRHRYSRPPLPRRTPAAVRTDVATHRACRQLAQAISDHDEIWAIWPDPPSARVIETQHRIDTAKQRKENDK